MFDGQNSSNLNFFSSSAASLKLIFSRLALISSSCSSVMSKKDSFEETETLMVHNMIARCVVENAFSTSHCYRVNCSVHQTRLAETPECWSQNSQLFAMTILVIFADKSCIFSDARIIWKKNALIHRSGVSAILHQTGGFTESQLLLRLCQQQPQLPPGWELFHVAEVKLHLLAGVPAVQRGLIASRAHRLCNQGNRCIKMLSRTFIE